MIDIDHLFDYVYGIIKKNYKHSFGLILSGKYFRLNSKIFILLHKIEIVIILFFFGIFLNQQIYLVASISLLTHLFQDCIQYKKNILFYSFYFNRG